jgi:curved DNA-binding protein CbpA
MAIQQTNSNYYEVLEIPTDAAQTDIDRSYQRARATYAQDNPALYSMFTPDEARDLVRLIEEAYSVLSNPVSRRTYDVSIGLAAPTPAPVSSSSKSRSAAHTNPPAPAANKPTARETVVEMSDDYVIRKKDAGRSALPDGMGKTPLSTYKLDEYIESEIRATLEYDGKFVHRVREYKNVNLEKLSEATRISRTYLTALEQNDYPSLPAPVFVRGFVVQVARILGLDEAKVANSYMKTLKAALESK